MPKELHWGGVLALHPSTCAVAVQNAEDAFAAQTLRDSMQQRGATCRVVHAPAAPIVLLRSNVPAAQRILHRAQMTLTPAMHDEGYVLIPQDGRLYAIATTAAGLFYAAQTMRQLLAGQGRDLSLHLATIRDWPTMRYRGFGDDLSRGPFPTLDYQKKQIRTFAAYKLNLYSPYFENTLQLKATPLAAPPGAALSPQDVAELVAYAQQYHITIIPDQESFGHLHHTLLVEQYANLAETPHGSVLAPGQAGSLPLISVWFTQIAQEFPSPFLHIGADETFDLGAGQTAPEVAKYGLGKVYIDFVHQIYNTLQPLHRQLLFWGDVAMNSPELVKTLPKNMIAVAWKYSPQPQGYDAWITPFTNAGMETWVAPGVSNWREVYPDNDAALQNIQRFVADGQRLGTTGELNTAWNDDGEGLFAQDWYGVLFGAAAGWQQGSSDPVVFEHNYGQVFHNDTTGEVNQAQLELMAAYQSLTKVGLNWDTDALFWMDPWTPQGREVTKKILPVTHEMRIHAENALAQILLAKQQKNLRNTDALDAMELGARRLDFIGHKFQQSQEMIDEYATMRAEVGNTSKAEDLQRLGATLSGMNGQCQDLRDGYGLLRDLYRQAWLRENRPYWLDNVTARYDMSMQLWIKRGMQIRSTLDAYWQTHTLQGMPIPQQ